MPNYINPASFGRLDPANWRDIPDHYQNCFWPDELPHSPRDYGSNDFHGRTHPEIVFVALERYTKPGDLVWDPMAGSGTVIDVCEELGNDWIAYDLDPVRDDILKADATTTRPQEAIDHVILHPPYMDIIKYAENEDNTLAVDDLNDYLDKMDAVFSNIDSVLKDWHVLTLIVGTVYKDGEVILLDNECLEVLRSVGDYRLLGRIIRGFGETKGGKITPKKSSNLWKYRRLKGGYWSLGQDYVLFLQKVGA